MPKAIATDSWVFKFPDKYEEYEIVKCNLFDIKSPEYAFVGILTVYDTRSYEVDFYKPENNNPFSKIVANYTGGTTIKNTTFPKLVEMAKEDCSQFQGGFVNEDPNGIHWTYTRADTTEEKAEDIRKFSYGKLKLFSEFMDAYGDIDEMTDEEVIALHERIKKEGLDEKVQMADKANDIHEELLSLSQNNWIRL